MSNSYDEIKKLLESSRAMRGDDTLLNEVRNTLKKSGLLTEQGSEGYETANNSMGDPRPNLAADTVREEITLENFTERKVDWKSGMDQVSFSLKTGETSVDTSYCSSSNWLGYTNLDYQFTEMLAQQMLDNPENYGLI
jgi:hypothetical protein